MTQKEIENELKNIAILSNSKHLKNVKKTEKKLRRNYQKASNTAGAVISSSNMDIAQLKYLEERLNLGIFKISTSTTKITSSGIDRAIRDGIFSSKEQINVFKSMLPSELIATDMIPYAFRQAYMEAALEMLKTADGLELSYKVWNMHNIKLRQMRMYLANSMMEGKSASEVYAKVKSFLKLPKTDMRTKAWREFFRQNPPGKGVYKSAWKNTLRLLRTETNRAFKLAQKKYASGKNWLKGIKYELSATHPEFDICDEYASADSYGMGSGIYPPEAIPSNSHPHCLCYYIYVLNYKYLGVETK